MVNIIENYLNENINKNYSVKNLSKKFNLNTKTTYYLIKSSDNIRIVDPIEVGSLKKKVYVFTYGKEKRENER
jgi:hypothetical protein